MKDTNNFFTRSKWLNDQRSQAKEILINDFMVCSIKGIMMVQFWATKVRETLLSQSRMQEQTGKHMDTNTWRKSVVLIMLHEVPEFMRQF